MQSSDDARRELEGALQAALERAAAAETEVLVRQERQTKSAVEMASLRVELDNLQAELQVGGEDLVGFQGLSITVARSCGSTWPEMSTHLWQYYEQTERRVGGGGGELVEGYF